MHENHLTLEMVDRDGAIAGAADIVTRPTFTEAA